MGSRTSPGGLLSRRAHFACVALIGQVSGLLLTATVASLVSAPALTASDLAWGALSGVGTGLGMALLYRGISRADMSIVVPVSAVGGVAFPVLVGVALLGDRPAPLAWVGVAVAVPALWLVSRGRAATGFAGRAEGTWDGLGAGVGIALQYLALAQVGPEAGIWPVVVGRLAAASTVVVFAARRPAGPGAWWSGTPLRLVPAAALTGGLAGLALVCYLLATRAQVVVVAVVLSSLYPAVPVLLGIIALRERLARSQVVGLLAAGSAIALLSIG